MTRARHRPRRGPQHARADPVRHTFSSTGGDFAAFVRCSEPGVNLRLMRGRRLHGRYPHLEGATVKRMRFADQKAADARTAELRSMVREWCARGDAARAKATAKLTGAPSADTWSGRAVDLWGGVHVRREGLAVSCDEEGEELRGCGALVPDLERCISLDQRSFAFLERPDS